MTAILTGTQHGPTLVPPFDVYVSQSLIRTGVFSPSEFATWQSYLPDGGTVLDIGANIGAHTIPFAHAVGPSGRVIAFEPQRHLAYMLCGTVALCGTWQVEVKQCALGKDAGLVRIPPLDYSGQNNFGALEVGKHTEGEPVPIIPLDATDFDRVDFMKLDVEGAELAVLEGAWQTIATHRPVLAIEADREPQVPSLLLWLKQHDYRAWWHRPPLGVLFPNVVSVNLLALPREKSELPEPVGDVELVIP